MFYQIDSTVFFIPEIHKKYIQDWKKDDNFFYETHSFSAMLLKVKQEPFVTFVGVPGSGKTATARHIALLLEKEGYAILPITDKSEIKTYCDPYNLQVFVIDDVIGIYKFDSIELNVLNRYKDIVVNPAMPKTKILMTCRETVFRHKKMSKIFLTKQENVILLQSEENALNDQDKRKLFAKYQIDPNIWKSGNLASSSNMFPFLCKLFSEDEKYKVYGLSFFITPVPCILKELDSMKRDNEIQYVSLMLLMINQNKLTEDMFSEYNTKRQSAFNEMKGKLLEKCQVPCDTYGYHFINALSEMEKTYTNKCGNEITFINDSLFEITACHFGRQCPEMILQYMSCDFIANNIKVDTRENDAFIRSENENELCIWLQEEKHHKLLAECLAKHVENDELHSVFRNEAMKHSTVLRAFIKVMEKMKFTQLYSIFLSKRRSESQEKCGFNPRMHLIDQASINTDLNDHITTVRAITWIIYYGHHKILQYIIDQCLKEEEEVDELYPPCNRYVFRNYEMMKQSDKINQLETRNPDTTEQFILLCLGCFSGCLNIVQILLKYLNKYAILNERNLGSTPLVIACKLGYSEIANELVKAGADINLDDTQVTPLLVACQKGHLCVVETLIRLGANVNLCFEFRTPLTVACQEGYFEIVKKLTQSGADVNTDNNNNTHTPLTIACEHGHARVVEELIQANSNVNLKGKFHTPLTAACQNGHVDVVEKLIKAGASVNLKCESTPLNIAVKRGHLSIVDKLINAKADVNFNDGKQTPLIVACEKGCLSLVKELIKAGADVHLNCALYTPLTAACKSDACTHDMRLCVVQELLNRGADVNLMDGNRTPLTAACFNEYLDIVEKLIQAGARVNQQDKTKTPLTTACWNGHLSVVKYLIEQRADVNLKDETRTPLTASCKRGHLDVVEELIKAKAKVNLSDGEWTPLTAASSKFVTEILLNAGAVLKCQKLQLYFERDI